MVTENILYKRIIVDNPYNDYLYTLLEPIVTFINQQHKDKDIGQLANFKLIAKELQVGLKKLKYNDRATLLAKFYSDIDLLRYYYELQTAEDKAFISLLTFEQVASYKQVKQIYQKELLYLVPETTSDLRLKANYQHLSAFLIFDSGAYMSYQIERLEDKITHRRTGFYFPSYIRLAYMAILPKHKRADRFVPIDIPADWKRYCFEAAIFKELPLIISSLQQRNIRKNQNGFLNIASLKTTQRRLGLVSFPNDPGYVKAFLLASFVNLSSHSQIQEVTPTVLKELFFHSTQITLSLLECLIFPYFGFRNFKQQYYCDKDAYLTFREVILKLPEKGWITLENIHLFMDCIHFDMNVYSAELINNLCPHYSGPNQLQFHNGLDIQKQKSIRRQTITSILLLAASLGFIELAYDPNQPELYAAGPKGETEGRFSACQMTALGAHLFLDKKQYTLPDTAVKTVYRLDETGQFLNITGNFDLVAEKLRDWTTTISGQQLKLDTNKILHTCLHKSDLRNSIQRLKSALEIPMPDRWKEQLMQLVQNSDQVKTVGQVKVFKLSAFDQHLHKLISQDEVLREITIKGQNFTIIVEMHNALKFLNRMSSLGYLLDTPTNIPINNMQFDQLAKTTGELRDLFDTQF